MQELTKTDEHARFVKRSILLAYIVTLQSRKLEMIILVHQMKLKKCNIQKQLCQI